MSIADGIYVFVLVSSLSIIVNANSTDPFVNIRWWEQDGIPSCAYTPSMIDRCSEVSFRINTCFSTVIGGVVTTGIVVPTDGVRTLQLRFYSGGNCSHSDIAYWVGSITTNGECFTDGMSMTSVYWSNISDINNYPDGSTHYPSSGQCNDRLPYTSGHGDAIAIILVICVIAIVGAIYIYHKRNSDDDSEDEGCIVRVRNMCCR